MINCGSFFSFTFLSWLQTSTGSLGFFRGYLTCAAAFLIAILVFLAGRSRYYCQPPSESLLAKTYRIIVAARFGCRKGGFSVVMQSHGGEFEDQDVKDVVDFLRVLPILSFFIIYWTLQNQV